MDGSDAARQTVAMFGMRDFQAGNLMGSSTGSGNNLTNRQLGHMINNTTEKNYPKVVVIRSKELNFNQIQVRNIMGLKFVKTNRGNADWASPFMGGFQTGGNGNAKRIINKKRGSIEINGERINIPIHNRNEIRKKSQ